MLLLVEIRVRCRGCFWFGFPELFRIGRDKLRALGYYLDRFLKIDSYRNKKGTTKEREIERDLKR